MQKFGIDVSYHQGKIDFSKIKGKVDFVIIRAGYGNALANPKQVDKCFEDNYAGCKKYGIPCGAYWYSYATSVEDAKKEAESCIAQLKGKKFEYPIYFDLEEKTQFAKGKTVCNKLVQAFCDTLSKAGYYAGLYMSRSPLQTYISKSVAKKYPLWIAEYNSKCNYDGDYGMWQCSSKGVILGIAGNVDVNYCYVDYPSKIKKAGKNGYKVAAKKSISTIASEVIAGKWGDGAERKAKLKAAGYDYAKVQAEVNKKLASKTATKASYSTYTVKAGDTLWDIAKAKLGDGNRYKEIKELNGLKTDVIKAGQKLKIPAK